jgi:hypothetical protein
MASEQDRVDGARRATGDDIVIAGLFAPRDDDAGDAQISSLLSLGADAAAGPRARPHRLVVAVSPTRVYLLRPTGPGDDAPLALVHTFDRRRVATTIHARMSARTLTLEDTWTGERYELVGERTPDAHVTATMHALSDIHELAS